MNVAVINVRDLLRFIVKILLIACTIIFLVNLFKNSNTSKIKSKIGSNKISSFLKFCINNEVGFIDNEKLTIDFTKVILTAEIGNISKVTINNIIVPAKVEIEVIEENEIEEEKEIIIGTEVIIEPVLENNIIPNYTNTYETVEINNKTSFLLTEEELNSNVEINKNNIAIYHTHTSESYTSSERHQYQMTGNYRTTDLNFTVARVGTELTKYLTNKGFNVLHNTTCHDYPTYSGSYSRSLESIKNTIFEKNTDIVLDIHRDAVGSSSEYAPRVKINGENVAQIMFVMGTNEGGLEHSNWRENLKFAILIQKTANKMYPGLFRPIILTQSRYNEHVAKAACIIEVGATGNTLEECILSMQCLANILEKALK